MKIFPAALSLALLMTTTCSAASFWDRDPHEVRKDINQRIFAIESEKPAVAQVKDLTIQHDGRTTPLRIYTPNGGEHLPVILFIHGGAWVAGSLETHDNMARYLCRGVQAVVVSVEYLNSPEGKFPLPLEQCYDALRWVAGHAEEIHADSRRLAVIGDSAGGNIAAALCLLARDRHGPAIDLQVLINPAPDLTGKGTLERQRDAVDPLRWMAVQYVKNPKDVDNPYVSPVMAKDLSNLPPAVIILAENDDLRQDGEKYAERLIAAGVHTNIYVQWGIGHLAGNGARASNLAQESLDVAVAALRGAFFRKTAVNQ